MTKVSTNLGKVGTTPKGEYNSATKYEKLDIVSYNGSSYVCLRESTGNLPTDTAYWQLMASKGDTGATGQNGYTPVKGIDYFTQADIESLNIPSKTSDLTNDNNFINNTVNDLVNYYSKSEVDGNYQTLITPNNKISADNVDDTNSTNKFFSGNYNDLSNKPTIPVVPTNVSSFTNDANYQNATQVQNAIDSVVGNINTILATLTTPQGGNE